MRRLVLRTAVILRPLSMSANLWELSRRTVLGLFQRPCVKYTFVWNVSLRYYQRESYQRCFATIFQTGKPKSSLNSIELHYTGVAEKKSESVCRLFGAALVTSRGLSSQSALSDKDLRKAIEEITENMAEARELLDDARTSHGTVYFVEDMKEAQEAVGQTLEDYKTLLANVTDDQKQNVLKTIGFRMDELKAQLQNVQKLASD